MSSIVFLALDSNHLQKAQEVFKAQHQDIILVEGLLKEGVLLASSLVSTGAEIIITRGGTASAIRKAGIPVTIVEIPITGFDIIRCVEKAKAYGRKIGVVAFPSMIMGIECLSQILGVEINIFPIYEESEAKVQFNKAVQNGSEVIIGGFISGKIAKEYNYPFVLIESGMESILQAAEEAKRIASVKNTEKAKTGLFRTVLDYAYEGIIAVDSNQQIIVFNPMAERITGIKKTEAIGKDIALVWPELNLEKVINLKEEDLGQILTINGIDTLCNKIPIFVNSNTVGAVVTFQDVTQIQQMEAKVRTSIYTTGHLASFKFKDIIGTSSLIKRTIDMAKNFALTESSILLFGETGTGKEVFAQSIHNYSKRQQGPFVAINCAALPSQILESELFGYVGGAFTGANQKGKPGLFEVAHGGTIFLDEIAEIDYITQGKLLRVLQEKKVMRLGSDRIVPIDVQVIAATNKNLKRLVEENKFRADLYYRLNVLQLKIPPLRARKEDIIPLAQFFLKENHGFAKRSLQLSPEASEALRQYSWPGNIRELNNIIQRIIAVYKQEIIDATIVKLMLEEDMEVNDFNSPVNNAFISEIEEIKDALVQSQGKYNEAAKILGISRTTLWRRMKRLGLK